MPLPFQVVYSDEIKISTDRVHGLVDTYRDRQRTGLIRLAYSPHKLIYLFFQRGLLLNSYSADGGSGQRISDWMETSGESAQAFARLIPLSPFALEMCQLAIESAAEQTETIPASNLRASLDQEWKQTVNPMLLHLGWETAEGLVFFQGGKLEGHSVFFSSDRLLDETGISSTFSFWSEPEAKVTSFQINLDLPSWQEYTLRRAFAEICEQALTRYEQITGRAIVDSIIRSLILYTSRQSLEINMTARRVINQELFSTPQAGAEVYQGLLKIMLDQVSQIIGSKLSLSIISDVTSSLRFDEFKVARDFSILPYELFRTDKVKGAPGA